MICEAACTETYLDVEKMIYRICWDFVQKYPQLDLDDCISAANMAFVEKKSRFDPQRGRFTTFIYWVVLNTLRDLVKSQKRADEHIQTLPNDSIDRMSPAIVFDLDILAGELSDDAAFVVRATAQLPNDPKANGRKYLVGILRRLDWTATRILESFAEIREALQ